MLRGVLISLLASFLFGYMYYFFHAAENHLAARIFSAIE